MRLGEQALDWAEGQVENPSRDWTNLCLKFVRECYGIKAKDYTNNGRDPWAIEAYRFAAYKHPVSQPAPLGVPIFWDKPGTPGHVVISAGDGMCYSTDVRVKGKVSLVPIRDVDRWLGSSFKQVGWTEDLNGVRVWTPPDPPEWYALIIRRFDGTTIAHCRNVDELAAAVKRIGRGSGGYYVDFPPERP